MIIKRKSDIKEFLFGFCLYAKWNGEKFYFLMEDENGGDTTLMQYPDSTYTFFRKNLLFWDIKEHFITEDELTRLIWGKRKYINKALRVMIL